MKVNFIIQRCSPWMVKRYLCHILIFVIFSFSSNIKALDIDIQNHTFYSQNSPYVELNLYVLRASLVIKENIQEPSVLVTVIIKNEGNIIHAERFNLIGENSSQNFSTIKRYGLEFGSFSFEVNAVDNGSSNNTFTWNKNIEIEKSCDQAYLSDLQILATIKRSEEAHMGVKNGFEMELLPYLFSRESMSELYYYIESYDTDLISTLYHVELLVMDDQTSKVQHIYHQTVKKKKAKKKDYIIGAIPLEDLPSGNYKVMCQIKDTTGQIFCSGFSSFQHSNQDLHKESVLKDQELSFIDLMTEADMIYSLKAITPRLASIDLEAIDLAIQSRSKSRLIHELKYHWTQLATVSVKEEYDAYMNIAKAVDRTFQSGFGAGFETDRGHYYLKFGRPDDIIGDKQEYDAPPYEIWTYNEIPELHQTNVKFVFYNPSLSPGNYKLLHSTAKGEPNNSKWKAILYKNTNDLNGKGTFDSDDVNDDFRRNAGRKFDDF